MSATLDEVKAHLRVRHADQDTYLTQLLNASQKAISDYAGDNYDNSVEDLKVAQLLLVEHLYYPSESKDTDPITGWPLSVAALAMPYRSPTVA